MRPRRADALTLALTGDVMLGRLVNEVLREQPAEYVWGDVLPLLRSVDAVLINLECALTSRTERFGDKAFYFRSDPEHVEALTSAGVRFASLANNHVLDFGPEGMRETIATLDVAGIAHAGAGGDATAAAEPAVLHVGDLRIAVLAWADDPDEWAATERSGGINWIRASSDPAALAAARRAVAAARDQADLVVVSSHWGPNMRARPSDSFKTFARAVVDAGADVFWGHSAHVVQGVEARQGRLVLYDTGDFVDDYRVDDDLRNDLSALFLVRLRERAVVGLDLVPVHIAREQVNLARGAARDWLARRFAELCGELGTAVRDEGDYLTVAV